jgi:hypothetical protein
VSIPLIVCQRNAWQQRRRAEARRSAQADSLLVLVLAASLLSTSLACA